MAQLKLVEWVRKYRYVLLVLLAGIMLMLLPTGTDEPMEQVDQNTLDHNTGLEQRLERILSRIQGAGQVMVMLTEEAGEEVIYQTDGDGGDTVLVTDATRSEQGLIRTREPPSYRGAIVVCSGGDSAAVRLAVAEAVSKVTGLGMDRITVLKME